MSSKMSMVFSEKTHWAIAALEKYIKSNKILKKPKRKSKISLQYIKQMFT